MKAFLTESREQFTPGEKDTIFHVNDANMNSQKLY